MENLKYMPVFRGRQQELNVLRSFDFGTRIYPCLEIIKEIDRQPPKPRKNSKPSAKIAKKKTFEEVYIPIIGCIRAEKVFVDLPVHLRPTNSMKPDTLDFLQRVVANRDSRTRYLKRLTRYSAKIIPIISSYFERTAEKNTIRLQATDLRSDFEFLAFRTFIGSFNRDISQIESIIQKKDYLILDLEDTNIEPDDEEQAEIIERLSSINCTIIIHRNAIPSSIKYVELVPNKIIEGIDNGLVKRFDEYGGKCFSDYVGIKKDGIIKGGGAVNPGFFLYDGDENSFYGYRGNKKDLGEYERVIVPAILSSSAVKRMQTHTLGFLNKSNKGWEIIQDIDIGIESGRSPAKFKRIGMEHYLHCIRVGIENGDFD